MGFHGTLVLRAGISQQIFDIRFSVILAVFRIFEYSLFLITENLIVKHKLHILHLPFTVLPDYCPFLHFPLYIFLVNSPFLRKLSLKKKLIILLKNMVSLLFSHQFQNLVTCLNNLLRSSYHFNFVSKFRVVEFEIEIIKRPKRTNIL